MSAYAGFTATVLQKNNEQFFCGACGDYAKDMYVPYGAAAAKVGDADYWAVPEKRAGGGYVTGFRWEIADEAPTYDSIACIRVQSLLNGDWWMIVGTRDQYFSTGAACCDSSPIPTMVTDTRLIFPAEQYSCTVDGGTNYDANFALPVLQAGQHYEIAGSFEGTAMTPAPTQNYASIAALISWLNTNWAEAGVWSSTNTPISIRARLTDGAHWVGFTACAVDN